MNTSLAAILAGKPDPVWLRLSRWTAIYAVLLFAGLNRWDGGSASTGRYVVLGLWAAAGISIIVLVRRSTALASQQLARPNGHAEMNLAVAQQKRVEWEIMKGRGRRDYVWRSGLRWAIPLTAIVYSLLTVLPSTGSIQLGSLPRAISLALILFTAIVGTRALFAWRSWTTLLAAWEKHLISTRPT